MNRILYLVIYFQYYLLLLRFICFHLRYSISLSEGILENKCLSLCFSETMFISSSFWRVFLLYIEFFVNHSIFFHYLTYLCLLLRQSFCWKVGFLSYYWSWKIIFLYIWLILNLLFILLLWGSVMFVLGVVFSVFLRMVYLFTFLNMWFNILFIFGKFFFIFLLKNCFCSILPLSTSSRTSITCLLVFYHMLHFSYTHSLFLFFSSVFRKDIFPWTVFKFSNPIFFVC